jgi:hypothetical protein
MLDSRVHPQGAAMTSHPPRPAKTRHEVVDAACLCGAVRMEIDFPAFWAWHDHSEVTRRAQGAAYATYVGVWRSRFRVAEGEGSIHRFEHAESRSARNFCAVCGTPLFYERFHSPKMVNIPRALFATRTGREPRYHVGIDQSPDWAWRDERLVPLKGFPGVVWHRPARRKALAS